MPSAVPPQPVLRKRREDASVPGQHLWVMAATWRCPDPERPGDLLDSETLISLTGPGCYKCERPYSRDMASRPCKGSLT